MSKRVLQKLAISICFAFCVIFLGQINALADEVEPMWTKLAPMYDTREDFQTEVIDGKIYAMGGDYKLSAEVYNPVTDTWTKLASMSVARGHFQTEVIDGKIYAIGGTGLSSTEVYDPTANSWTKLASMSTKRSGFQTEVINGKIYAIGGTKSSFDDVQSSTEVYDPNTNSWTKLASMSIARLLFQTEVIDGKIYAIGGYNGNNLTSTEVYDPITDSWTKLASMFVGRESFQTEVIDGKIYAMGGSKQLLTEVYDPATDTWTKLASMSDARNRFQTEVIDGKIYAIGGPGLSSTEVYDITANSWTKLASMSAARPDLQTEVIDGKIYAIGGGEYSSMEVYAVTNSSVKQLKATGGDSKVDLSWDTVTRATSYTVKRSTTAGGPYTSVVTDLTETSYTDTDVTNGTTYYYVVTAAYNGTEIGNSNEASAQPTSQTPPVTDSKLKVVLEVSEALRLSVDDDLNVNTQMSWSSSDPTVATVNEKGIVTALAPGNTIITVKSADGSYTDYINVLVVENADDYRLAIDLKAGETARLTADDFTNTANITWAPMDSAIANVTNKGKVTALSKGLVLISAKDAEGNIIGRIYVRVRE